MTKVKVKPPEPQGTEQEGKDQVNGGCMSAVYGVIMLGITAYIVYILFF